MFKSLKFIIIFFIYIVNNNSLAQNMVVDITEGNVAPLPIAVQKFVSDSNSNEIGLNVVRVIVDDLVSTGLFNAIDSKAYIEKPISPSIRPVFSNWDPLGVKALVTGSASLDSSGMIEVEFRLWDV